MLGTIGKYELQSELGQGSSGTVYLALDTFSESQVALKVINPTVFHGSELGKSIRKQFLNEASLVGKLSHPHIIQILDAVVSDEASYIAMEYVPGGSLAAFSDTKELMSADNAIEIGFKCCGALDYAYRQGIVHRDIKPANIMLVQGTEIKIADFGAALLQRANTTQVVDVIGSPSYMSPEQISGKLPAEKSDMFALGVVLFELLTGHKPFVARNQPELIQKILHHDPPPVRNLRASLPDGLDAVLLGALAKQPEDRYSTWANFALELARIGRLSVYEQGVPDSEKFRYLRAMKMLNLFEDPEIWELVYASRWERMPAHSVIVRENEPGQSLFLLPQGEVKVTKRGKLLNVLRAGECFGEMSYVKIDDTPRQATVESITEVVIAEFDREAIERRVKSASRLVLVQALLNTLVDRLAMADERISSVIN